MCARARLQAGVRPTFKTVDTCGAEFEADTPYHYSTYEDEDEVRPSDRPKVVILGSGPNRIGQGIEFDYCCVHASFALRDAGFETIMINCNPETVSTDYDTSDRLYFEPLTYEDVMNVLEAEEPIGVIVSLGGQTPLKLANILPPELVRGTSAASIDLAEDRERWNALCARLEIPQPAGGTASTVDAALAVVERVGYPVLMRPSYVLGGRAMEIVYDEEDLRRAMKALAGFGSLGREGGLSAERPVLVDRFLEDATEVDVDAIRDHTGDFVIGGVMEHVEEAGVHSGDSACALPPYSLSDETIGVLEDYTRRIADELDVRGLINVQFAVKSGQVFVIEANPRASRTVPFVAKATGVPLAKVAVRVMMGATLAELRVEGLLTDPVVGDHLAMKEAVLPFSRFPDADAVLGPEMRSTGEVMGIDLTFGLAFAKSQLAAGMKLPESGTVFLSLADRDKPIGVRAARRFVELGFSIAATPGTAEHLRANGIDVGTVVAKIGDPSGHDAVELISSGKVDMVVNSPRGRGPRADGAHIRTAAGAHGVPLLTTAAAALAAAGRHGRLAPPRDTRAQPAGVPPRCVHRSAGAASMSRPRSVASDVRARRTAESLVDLRTSVGPTSLPNPVMTASGTAGYGDELARYVALGELGAVVVKSQAIEPWPGNPPPRVHETPAGMLNSVGLQGDGIKTWLADELPSVTVHGARVVASIWGRTVDEYRAAAEVLADAPADVIAVEVNLSCPNLRRSRHVRPVRRRRCAGDRVGHHGRRAQPVWAKLTAHVTDVVPVARAVRAAGASAVTLINTIPGMVLDLEARAPLLGAGAGGLSGPAIHPVAVRTVYDVHRAEPDLPIVGVGGVANGAAAVELMLAGASAVQIGTATFADPRAPARVLAELTTWCDAHGVRTITDIIGDAHHES